MINLLSPEIKKEIHADYHRRVISVCLPIFSLVMIFAILTLIPSYFLSVSTYKKILKESQSAEVVSKQNQQTEMLAVVREVNRKIQILKEPSSKNVAWDLYNKIFEFRNNGVTITNFTFDRVTKMGKNPSPEVNINLQGVSVTRDDIQNFANALKKIPDFISVDLPISSLVMDANFDYSINIKVKE